MELFLNIVLILSILILILLMIICCISIYENKRFVVTKYFVSDTLIPDGFNGYHIVHLTDLHNASYGKNNSKLIQSIERLEPDLILVTGDILIGKPGKDVVFAANTLNRIAKIAPLYFSMGNHELRLSFYKDVYGTMWNEFLTHLTNDVHLLFNDVAVIKQNHDELKLYGLNLTPLLYKRLIKTKMKSNYMESIFGKCDETKYHILMAHNPDYFEEYAKWGANLVFSGHIHGGMIHLPFIGGVLSPMVRFFPKYDKGKFKYNNKMMILSGGLGNHTFKFRVNNLPEIISVKLNNKI